MVLQFGSMEQFEKFVDWGFMALLSGGVAYAARFLSKLQTSVAKLNEQIATILERTSWHQREIENHEHRLSSLEGRRQKSHEERICDLEDA